MTASSVYIVSAARTPIGSFLGGLSSLSAPALGAIALQSAATRARVALDMIDEVFMGNVLTAGVGQAPARQAAIASGIPNTVPTTTVGKVCGSGLQAVILGARSIAVGDADIVASGGMESMSNTPYYLQKARAGYRMGDGKLVDGMVFDGLWDPYNNVHMGQCGDACARRYDISRQAQDEHAKESFRRALLAQEAGLFDAEIEPVMVPQRKGEPVPLKHDEGPSKGDAGKFASLKPAFSSDGTVTAANASSINDGASALILASEAAVHRHNLKPVARIVGYASNAHAPEWFTTAPASGIDMLRKKLGLNVDDIDLFEVNEAFAVVALVTQKLCGIPPEKMNVRGGAVALGHPIGASGARILTTLLFTLIEQNKKRGLASICIGGGEALSLVIER